MNALSHEKCTPETEGLSCSCYLFVFVVVFFNILYLFFYFKPFERIGIHSPYKWPVAQYVI